MDYLIELTVLNSVQKGKHFSLFAENWHRFLRVFSIMTGIQKVMMR